MGRQRNGRGGQGLQRHSRVLLSAREPSSMESTLMTTKEKTPAREATAGNVSNYAPLTLDSRAIAITPRAAAQIARGQLWIFSNEIHAKPASASKGMWCRFVFRD